MSDSVKVEISTGKNKDIHTLSTRLYTGKEFWAKLSTEIIATLNKV